MLSRVLLLSSLFLLGKNFTAAAQTTPVESVAPVALNETAATSRAVLFKLGTGLIRGAEFSGYAGVTLPFAVGAEYAVKPGWNIYVNGVTGINAGGGQNSFDRSRYVYLRTVSADLGVRRYYNQEKRRKNGRSTGPFTGNYVALQSSSNWDNNLYYNRGLRYDYSNLVALWGMQRRLGGHGLVDAYAGGGIANDEQVYRELTNNYYSYKYKRFPPRLDLELGVKLSLVF
ncbi:hypothetical protein [Hymenobacter sp. YC55]|uniref:hypothetical protein n=1 Tax=Hymenobacter sp. YC55 TaxID=3034019 RepID=UPI0023F8EC22|nr:hypothetical protein [Hymenobacter sp. YC55]MDF7810951.1 hypothetical protein [Hymenobacter sp. YC55]